MQISAEHYFHASIERIHEARRLYRSGDSYAFSMYAAGLAVECILRAFRWKRHASFEGRHDLQRLFVESGLLAVNEAQLHANGVADDEIIQEIARLHGWMDLVVRLWENDLRFAPDALVRSKLGKLRRYERKRGDLLKLSALELITTAQEIVERGAFLWIWSKK